MLTYCRYFRKTSKSIVAKPLCYETDYVNVPLSKMSVDMPILALSTNASFYRRQFLHTYISDICFQHLKSANFAKETLILIIRAINFPRFKPIKSKKHCYLKILFIISLNLCNSAAFLRLRQNIAGASSSPAQAVQDD